MLLASEMAGFQLHPALPPLIRAFTNISQFKRFRPDRAEAGGGLEDRRKQTGDGRPSEEWSLRSWPTQSTDDFPSRSSDTTAVAGGSSTFFLRRATTSGSTASASLPRNTHGLTLVHNPQDATADVIFVHGLGGSSWNTWCWKHDPSMFWPAWLQHEQGLSQFRVFTFGYNANFRGPDTSLSILDFAKGLLVRMRGYGNEDAGGDTPLGKVCGRELSPSGLGTRR